MKKIGNNDSFAKFYIKDQIYIDKTETIYNLLDNEERIFISRPRRFCKSLTLDTIAVKQILKVILITIVHYKSLANEAKLLIDIAKMLLLLKYGSTPFSNRVANNYIHVVVNSDTNHA